MSDSRLTWARSPAGRTARWLAAACIVVLAGLIPGMLGVYRVCEDRVAGDAEPQAVNACRPPNVTDLPVASGILLIGLLLLPDLEELSLGFLRLKKVSEETMRRQESLERSFVILERQVTIANSQASSFGNQMILNQRIERPMNPAEASGLLADTARLVAQSAEDLAESADFRSERARFSELDTMISGTIDTVNDWIGTYAVRDEGAMYKRWNSEIAASIQEGQILGIKPSRPVPEFAEAVQDVLRPYEAELRAIRAVRSNLESGNPPSSETLSQASLVMSKILTDLRGLEAAPDHRDPANEA